MRLLLKALGVLAMLIIILVLFIQFSYKVDYSAEYPVEELNIEYTSERIAHGEYLAYGPAHCASCHIPFESIPDVAQGKKVDMIGGFSFTIPPATLYSTNLTPDPETGIGNLSDGELYRMLRYNIKHDGTTTIELMPFSTMSDEDIYSIIAFLRSQKPVHNEVPASDWHFLGKALLKFAIKPIDDGKDEHPVIEKAVTEEYGQYLAASVANCRGCHTERDLKTGAFVGQEYAGGFIFEASPETQGWVYTSPNITSGGLLKDWDENMFIDRILNGRTHMTSPMPWEPFARMDSTDLRALWKFLSNVEPSDNVIEQVAIPPAE